MRDSDNTEIEGQVRVPFHAWHLNTTREAKHVTHRATQIAAKPFCGVPDLAVHIREDTCFSSALLKAAEILSHQSWWAAFTASQAARAGFY